MRTILFLGLPLLLAAARPGPDAPACGAVALQKAPDVWDARTAITGDLTLDGRDDVVYWKRDRDGVLLFIVSCDGEAVKRSWRLRVPLAGDCPPDAALVQMASILIDPAVVERVCTTGEASECAHLRRENARRQALVDAGAREMLVGAACSGSRLRWSDDLGGWMVLGLQVPG